MSFFRWRSFLGPPKLGQIRLWSDLGDNCTISWREKTISRNHECNTHQESLAQWNFIFNFSTGVHFWDRPKLSKSSYGSNLVKIALYRPTKSCQNSITQTRLVLQNEAFNNLPHNGRERKVLPCNPLCIEDPHGKNMRWETRHNSGVSCEVTHKKCVSV